MRSFIEVVERGSFSRAAHALHLGVATVSERIAHLERHVGTSLLTRTTRSVAMTDDGAEYYAVCKRVIDELGAVEESLAAARTRPQGRLRVEVGDGIVSRLLLPVLPEFQARFPDVTLHLEQKDHMFDLAQQGYDVMIRALLEPPRDSGLIVRRMGRTRNVFAASPDYLKRHGVPLKPHDLLRHQCIGFIDPLTSRLWEWFFERDGKRSSLEVPHRLALSRGELRVDAAVRGLGVINDLECNLREPIRDGALVLILKEWAHDLSLFHILYPRKRHVARKVTAFVNFVLEKYPPDHPLDPPREQGAMG